MESAASIRVSNPMVAAGDRTDVLTEYGIRIAEPSVVAKAKAIVDHFVADADARFSAHVEARRLVPQSPYDDLVIEGQELRQVAVVQLATLGDFEAELLARLGPKHGHYVDGDQLSRKVGQVFSKLLEDHGFEVVACKTAEYGGGLTRVIVRDPIHIATVEAAELAQALGSPVAIQGDIGVRSPCGPRQLDALRRVIDSACKEAMRDIATYLAFATANGSSPFGTRDFTHYTYYSVIADERRVKDESSYRYIAQGARVPLAPPTQLIERAQEAVGKSVTLEASALADCFMKNLAGRMREHPELMVATLFTDRDLTSLAAVCSPEPPPPPPPAPPAPPKLTWFGRIAQYFTRIRQSAKALPAPPPEPVVVPAIKFETEAKE